jgi:hypothetical protein
MDLAYLEQQVMALQHALEMRDNQK